MGDGSSSFVREDIIEPVIDLVSRVTTQGIERDEPIGGGVINYVTEHDVDLSMDFVTVDLGFDSKESW